MRRKTPQPVSSSASPSTTLSIPAPSLRRQRLPLRLRISLRPLWLALALSLIASGCFGPRADLRHHYILSVPSAVRGDIQHEGLVRVEDLDVSRVYDRRQMIVRRSDVEVRYEANRLWAESPHQLISDHLAAWLDAEGVFRAVSRQLGDRPPTWTLAGRVRAFEIIAREKKWSAHLSMTLELRSFKDGSVQWRYAFDSQEAIPTPAHADAARGLSRLLTKALKEASLSLRKAEGILSLK